MAFWNRKSRTDLLVETLQQMQAQNASTTKAMLDAMTAQSQVFKEYLALFAAPTQPEVRIMSDADEARQELLRSPRQVAEAFTPFLGPTVDPQQWLADSLAELQKDP